MQERTDTHDFDAKFDSLKDYLRADREEQRAERETERADREIRLARFEREVLSSIERTNARLDLHTLEVRTAQMKHEHDTQLALAAFEKANEARQAASDAKHAELKVELAGVHGDINGIKTSLNMLSGVLAIGAAVVTLMFGFLQYELSTYLPPRAAASTAVTTPR